MSHPGPGPAHHVPTPGRTPGLRIGEGANTHAADFVNVQGRLFAPLAGLDPNDVLEGGYGWLSWTDYDAYGDPHTLHPGVDLNSGQGGGCNADLGSEVVAMLAGVVRAVLPWDGSPGEGNHLWYEVVDEVSPGPTWVHHDHLSGFAVQEGQRVAPGELIGWCGASGNWECAHGHVELLPSPPAQGWWQWPFGWSQGQVETAYYNPRAWWDAAVAKVGQAPPEVVVSILSGAQTAAVEAVMFGEYPFDPDNAIPRAWREDWRAGVWRGRALSAEQPIPEDPSEGKPAGVFQLFEHGVCVWLPDQPPSWNG